jgi:endonuclease/exonuclease/phosphatase family metal-dependent hydrolase
MFHYLNKRFITHILLLLNLGLIISLICAYLAPYISPAIFWPLAFFGLAYPVIVLLNVMISLVWLVLKPRYALFSILFIVVGIHSLRNQYQWNRKATNDSDNGFTIVSFNVHDFYGIENSISRDSSQKKIFDFIRNQNPRIVCMQDLPVYWTNSKNAPVNYAIDLDMKSIYINSVHDDTLNTKSATAILSNYPRIDVGEISDQDQLSFAVYNDLLIGSDTVRVYSVHLASVMLFEEKQMLTANGIVRSSKRGIPRELFHIIKKLKAAFVRRAEQIDILKADVLACPFPVIVCGDFNDTPLSYTIHKIRHGLKDSFIEKGSGFGRTYIGSNVPLRIDNVFADPSFTFISHEVINNRLSDHLPVIIHLSLNENPATFKKK